MCDCMYGFKELDISTRKKVNSLPVKSARYCVLTFDNKFLITADSEKNGVLTKWLIRSKKLLHTWRSGVNKRVSL